ncbi:MAG: histidine--tRNA ligase, partial [Candidatus Cloacimonadota bacterium]
MAAKYKIPRGTYDILPDQSYIRRFLQDKFREAAETFNYREIITPIFEVADLFERTV